MEKCKNIITKKEKAVSDTPRAWQLNMSLINRKLILSGNPVMGKFDMSISELDILQNTILSTVP